jgi:transcriptional regulator with XRE-family HTH domain
MDKTPPTVSRAGRRFHELILYLTRDDDERGRKRMKQEEIAKAIGVSSGLISKWRNPHLSLRAGIGDGIIMGCMTGLKIDPRFFFSEHPEPVDVGDLLANVYSLDEARKEARERDRDRTVGELQKQLGLALKQIAALTQAVSELTSQRKSAASR